MFVIGSDLFVISPLLPLISADYAVPASAAGLSVTVFGVTYMLSAPALGHLADRVGRGRVLTWCLCAFGAANLLTAIAGDFTWLLATRIVAGAAAAGVSPSIYSLAGSSAPPERRATRLAIVVSGLLMSLSFGTPIGLLTAASLGWSCVREVQQMGHGRRTAELRSKLASLCSIGQSHPFVPTCRPVERRAQPRSRLAAGHRRRRRAAVWTAASTVLG